MNRARLAAGKDEANAIWTWSPGRRQPLPSLQELYGVRGAVNSAVDLIMGLGVCVGMDLIRVPGATGLSDTNYEGKAQACLDALADHDLVYVHVEATDEAGHARDLDLKIRCIEYLDQRLVGRSWRVSRPAGSRPRSPSCPIIPRPSRPASTAAIRCRWPFSAPERRPMRPSATTRRRRRAAPWGC